MGWVAGVAYEMPDIAARVWLTYNSSIDHDFDMKESGGPLPVTMSGNHTVTTPRSWTLEGARVWAVLAEGPEAGASGDGEAAASGGAWAY